MMYSTTPCTRHLFSGLLLFGLMVLCEPATAQDTGGVDLFNPVDKQSLSLNVQQNQLLQGIEARPYAAEVFLTYAQKTTTLRRSGKLTLELVADKQFTATVEKRLLREDHFTWIGHVPNGPAKEPGQVLLVVDDNDVTGRFQTNQAVYTVEPLGNGLHAIVRQDPSKLPACATDAGVDDGIGGTSNTSQDVSKSIARSVQSSSSNSPCSFWASRSPR